MAEQPNDGRSKVERYVRYREWRLLVVGHFEPQLRKHSSHCWLVHRGEKAEPRQALANAMRYVYLEFHQIRQSCQKKKKVECTQTIFSSYIPLRVIECRHDRAPILLPCGILRNKVGSYIDSANSIVFNRS